MILNHQVRSSILRACTKEARRDRGHSRGPGGDFQGLAVRGQERIETHADGDTPMILECGDLDRALRTPELMPDMRAHAGQCAACRDQLYLWDEISRLAPGLHEEWESPFLWPRIQANLAAEPTHRRTPWWRWALAAAALLALAALLQPWWNGKPANRELLTESALRSEEHTS